MEKLGIEQCIEKEKTGKGLKGCLASSIVIGIGLMFYGASYDNEFAKGLSLGIPIGTAIPYIIYRGRIFLEDFFKCLYIN